MTNEEFKQLLKKAGLKSKKDFANLLGIKPQSVHSWGTTKPFPYWVESWLQNYIKAKTLDNVKDVICNEDDPNSTAS
ncbi:hypothetical protein NitYY0826_C1530 [Nitratiruptor sp. YY08-26]|uniref:helix-turn-helix domain-containing protein n=1 Tax=unclassified Nitratiruptor TaxID=2624044 RepID=UPI001915E33D|nr:MULTISPECIES: helix-turn-helix transcriptional regulator [unclassified Nitratiruptor]BCD62648.1 hypothetical protein NitYY0813_C1528 [Nitratiruptor sp. YY08-13]BCD66584.1 hypothetical protein NitYY0826_C1530 [Nitratiruptor sp. YY08-26]